MNNQLIYIVCETRNPFIDNGVNIKRPIKAFTNLHNAKEFVGESFITRCIMETPYQKKASLPFYIKPMDDNPFYMKPINDGYQNTLFSNTQMIYVVCEKNTGICQDTLIDNSFIHNSNIKKPIKAFEDMYNAREYTKKSLDTLCVINIPLDKDRIMSPFHRKPFVSFNKINQNFE